MFRAGLAVLVVFTTLLTGVEPVQAANAASAPGARAICPPQPVTKSSVDHSGANAPAPRTIQPAADSTANFSAPTTPRRMIPDESYVASVTVTNTTNATWPKSAVVLSYRWRLWDGTDYSTPANQTRTSLPADLLPGASVTLDAEVKTPIAVDLGNQRESFLLDWDTFDSRVRQWMSQTAGVAPLTQPVTVEFPTSDELGLEKFFQYAGGNAGAGWTVMVNQFSGNVVAGYNALSNPSRGLATFVRLNYNSLDNTGSYLGTGWSLSTSSLVRLGSPLQGHGSAGAGYPRKITMVDGDGTSHVFDLNKHGSSDPKLWEYDPPAGVHLYLQRTFSSDPMRQWVMTRPERTRAFFDAQGYQTAVADKNGNELRLNYVRSTGGRNTGVLLDITDSLGRRTLSLDYYQRGDDYSSFVKDKKVPGTALANPSIIMRLKSITDISGRRITFTYSDSGQLQEVVDGAGTSAAKPFGMFYESGKLARLNDALGHGTKLTYYPHSAGEPRRMKAQSLVDRRNFTSNFDYADADGNAGSSILSTVTDTNRHNTTSLIDGFGRLTKLTNAKQESTELAWDEDNNVRFLREHDGATTTWVYDTKTRFPLQITDSEANARGGPPTRLGYRTGLNGRIADLVDKTSPEGRKWTFGYDGPGNLTSVTDPKGTGTPDPNDFTTRYTYDQFGQLLTATDARSHTTRFEDFDATGYPHRTVDPLGCTGTLGYDVVGNVITATDARGKTSTFHYDIFSRPLDSTVSKDAAKDDFIVTPGPRYDGNDNVVATTAANGAVATAAYDAADQVVSLTAPKDLPDGPDKITTFSYDPMGNMVKQTQPKGTLTTGTSTDFVTTYSYDELNRMVSAVDADGNRTSYSYDKSGNLTTLTDPRKNATPDPADFTTKYGYDLNHRVTKVTDALGKSTSRAYDRDGNVTATTDAEGNTTLTSYDERSAVAEVKVPHRLEGNNTIVYQTTRFGYDAVGNRTKTITPRGVETPDDPDDFVQEAIYDEVNRVKEVRTPFDKDDERVKTPDSTFYGYDEIGRLIEVNTPPSGGQSVRNITRNTYFDNGWARSSTDPWGITTSYDYDDLGNQTSRVLTAAGGSTTREMTWDYYPDGKLKSRKDTGVPVGRETMAVDNHDPATEVVGTWGTGGTTGDTDHEGFDYRLHNAGNGSDKFAWRLDVPRNGTYEVFVRYATAATATNATYTIEHDGGSTAKTVDQTQQAGQWVSLGSYAYTEDQIRKITLSDQADGTVVADAVKLVRDAGGEVDNEQRQFGYSYDPNGNLVEMTDSDPAAKIDTYAIAYTGLNQVRTIEEKLKGTVGKTTGYTYDPNGNTLTRSHNTQNSLYEYDVRDLLAKVTNTDTTPGAKPQVTTFTYTDRTQPDVQTKANGNTVKHEYHLDSRVRSTVEKKADNTTLVSQHFLDYDANGNRVKDASKTMNADNHAAYLEFAHTYGYDPRDRARKVTKTDAGGKEVSAESYVHDANNAIVEQNVENKTTFFTYDRTRLITTKVDQATTTHSYDPFGRLDKVTEGGRLLEKYRYDGFDRVAEHQKLKEGSATERVTMRYAYDPMDRTTTKIENPGAGEKRTDFTYLGLSTEVLTEELAGKLDKSYQYSPNGERLAQTKHNTDGSQETTQYGYNPHTDVESVTDDKGDTKATYGYTAYGKDDKESFTGIDKPDAGNPEKDLYNPYRFNGKRFDKSTGDYDMGFRDYDPGRNSFLSRDNYNGALADLRLAVDPFTGSRYGFAGGNPISNVELDGHCAVEDGMEIGCGARSRDPESVAAREAQQQERDQLAQAQADWTEQNSPKTNDSDRLGTVLYLGNGVAANELDWWSPTSGEDGESQPICFGRTACNKAYQYLLSNENDVEGAKRIAANYCVDNFEECSNDASIAMAIAEAYEVGTAMIAAGGLVSRLLGGKSAGGTAKSTGGSMTGAALARAGRPAEDLIAARIGIARNAGPGQVRVPGSGRGGYRIPDFDPAATIAARGTVVEVKDVASLTSTQQLRDLVGYSQSRGVPLEIFTNARLPARGQLAGWIQRGQVIIRPL